MLDADTGSFMPSHTPVLLRPEDQLRVLDAMLRQPRGVGDCAQGERPLWREQGHGTFKARCLSRYDDTRLADEPCIPVREVLVFLTVSSCKPLKVMYVRGVQTCFGTFWGKKSYRDVR
jgi:hypothetical protein